MSTGRSYPEGPSIRAGNCSNPGTNGALRGSLTGIGTTNPQHMLHVAGTIGEEEVVITPRGADYVFAPDYHLQPLNEVKAFIDEHHHLPDIPSAAEVKEKGIGVGDMQTKLLAKIEELTLHVIRAEERNSRLEREVAGLSEQLSLMNPSGSGREAALQGGRLKK